MTFSGKFFSKDFFGGYHAEYKKLELSKDHQNKGKRTK